MGKETMTKSEKKLSTDDAPLGLAVGERVGVCIPLTNVGGFVTGTGLGAGFIPFSFRRRLFKSSAVVFKILSLCPTPPSQHRVKKCRNYRSPFLRGRNFFGFLFHVFSVFLRPTKKPVLRFPKNLANPDQVHK